MTNVNINNINTINNSNGTLNQMIIDNSVDVNDDNELIRQNSQGVSTRSKSAQASTAVQPNASTKHTTPPTDSTSNQSNHDDVFITQWTQLLEQPSKQLHDISLNDMKSHMYTTITGLIKEFEQLNHTHDKLNHQCINLNKQHH